MVQVKVLDMCGGCGGGCSTKPAKSQFRKPAVSRALKDSGEDKLRTDSLLLASHCDACAALVGPGFSISRWGR
jgi:hypothetical protein